MRIQHNIMAMNAYRNYNKNTSALAKNLEKLSSGYKINRAGDDAAGLAISEKMRAQITGLEAAQKNVKDGISLVNTAEGAMQEIQDMMNRMVYLATESANGTFDNEVDRKNLQAEVDQLRDEINRIADSANFNGIKLLDGSLDAESTANISAGSAIQNVITTDYMAEDRPSDAFEATYITNRPEAATKQQNAQFKITFDDKTAVQPKSAATTATLEVKIGDATLEVKAASAGKAMTASDIAAQLAKSGMKQTTANAIKHQSDNKADMTTDAGTAADWEAGLAAGSGSPASNYVKIDGHYYAMFAAGNTVTFTQVDWMGKDAGTTIHPDFDVEMKAKNTDDTGTLNWKVQNTKTGIGIGATHQAQVSVDLDFSKLKDGDTLNVGDMKYDFKLDSLNTAANDGTSGKKTIDLTDIFKTEADLLDADKQAAAMVKIVGEMGSVVNQNATNETNKNNTWSVGNGGVSGGKGTLTFQSLSTYDGDTNSAANHPAYIGGGTTGTVCDMRTEAGVMKQFFGTSKEAAASVSFELDVTKIKEGDTITIDGVTFEFTDGDNATGGKQNIVVNLSKLGLANGGTVPEYNTNDVLIELKNAINKNLAFGGSATKYNVTIDGNKMTLTSKDISGTDVEEQRIGAKVELSSNSYEGRALTLQIGDTSDDFNQLAVSVKDMHTASLGIDGINIGTAEGAKAAINVIKDAINSVSSVRGTLGALSNRLDHTSNNLSVMRENIQDAESSIRDTDVAEEMMSYTKNNIFNLRKEDKINQRVKKPVFMRLCGEVALGCEECLAA